MSDARCGNRFEEPYDSGEFHTCYLRPHNREIRCARREVVEAANHMMGRRFRIPRRPPWGNPRDVATWALEIAARAVAPPKRKGEDTELRCEDVAAVLRGPLMDRVLIELLGIEKASPEQRELQGMVGQSLRALGHAKKLPPKLKPFPKRTRIKNDGLDR